MDYSLTSLLAPLPEDIEKLKWNGAFTRAIHLIDLRLQKDLPQMLRERLMIEKEILKRMPLAYPFDRQQALEKMRAELRDFQDEELDILVDEGAVEWIFVNGEMHFAELFLESLCIIRKDYKERLCNPEPVSLSVKARDEVIQKMKRDGKAAYRFKVRASIQLKGDLANTGGLARVYLPVPNVGSQISNVEVTATSDGLVKISAPDALQRTAYFEVVPEEGKECFVEYTYENHMTYIEPDSGCVTADQPGIYLGEQLPHIQFSEYLKALTREVVGEEKNPLLKAKKIYYYITGNVNYSFMRPYAALTHITEYAASGMKGDCGVQALLFITMCRIAGVPARWQAGLYTNPHDVGNHDWAQFYVAPYGWLYADCSFGGSARRDGDEERRAFYFGNLDPFRMVANLDFQANFDPPMKFLRQDPYDNQTGEVEFANRGATEADFEHKVEILEAEEIA